MDTTETITIAGRIIEIRCWGIARQLDAVTSTYSPDDGKKLTQVQIIALAVQAGYDLDKQKQAPQLSAALDDITKTLLDVEDKVRNIRRNCSI